MYYVLLENERARQREREREREREKVAACIVYERSNDSPQCKAVPVLVVATAKTEMKVGHPPSPQR